MFDDFDGYRVRLVNIKFLSLVTKHGGQMLNERPLVETHQSKTRVFKFKMTAVVLGRQMFSRNRIQDV